MKLFIAACLLAVSLAQTGLSSDYVNSDFKEPQDGSRRRAGHLTELDWQNNDLGILPGCECIPINPTLGVTPEKQALIDMDYGSYCTAWETLESSPYAPTCQGADWCELEANWCSLEWCYVPSSCPTAAGSDQFEDEMWFSYETCGNPDCFSNLGHAASVCPWAPDDVSCTFQNDDALFIWHLFLTECDSHEDCEGEDDDHIFCYEGYCNTCDECQFCIDGIDGTCSPCGDEYPLFESSENCLTVSNTCNDYIPQTNLNFEEAILERNNLDCIDVDDGHCDILYGNMGTIFDPQTGTRTSIKLRITMAEGYEGTYVCQGHMDSEDESWREDTPNPNSPNDDPRCIDNLWQSNDIAMGALNIAPTEAEQKFKFEIVDDGGVAQPFHILSMTFLDIDGANENHELAILHEVSEVSVTNPTYVIVENTNQDPFFWNLDAGAEDVIVRNDHRRCCGPRCNDQECKDTLFDPTNTCDSHSTCQIDNPTTIARFNNNDDQQAASAGAIWRSPSATEPLYAFYVSMLTDPDAQGSGTSGRTMNFWGFSSALVPETCIYCDEGFNLDQCAYGPKSDPEEILCQRGSLNLCNQNTCCEGPISTSHGDPIIWTFNGECYDLHRDGTYLATSHPTHRHDVWLSVYNDFIRDIYVIEKRTGALLLSINSLGDVIGGDIYPYRFTDDIKKCPEAKISEHTNECIDTYREWSFDALDFRFYVQLLRHDYLDQALKEGELGFHLDIYPEPYRKFKEVQSGYTGLYFENPLPEELEYCPGGSNNGDAHRPTKRRRQ